MRQRTKAGGADMTIGILVAAAIWGIGLLCALLFLFASAVWVIQAFEDSKALKYLRGKR